MATIDPDEPAFPNDKDIGLTKREEFAKAAMQGLLAHPENGSRNATLLAQWAVDQADALIAALNKAPEGQP